MLSSLKFLYSRRLRLAAIAHTYPILLHIACNSCLLARTTRVGVTDLFWATLMLIFDSADRQRMSLEFGQSVDWVHPDNLVLRCLARAERLTLSIDDVERSAPLRRVSRQLIPSCAYSVS
jgi:hypothetical protein